MKKTEAIITDEKEISKLQSAYVQKFKSELKGDSYKMKHKNDIFYILPLLILAILYVIYDGLCASSTV